MLTNNFYIAMADEITNMKRNYNKIVCRNNAAGMASEGYYPFSAVNGIIQANGTSQNYDGMGGLIIGTGTTPPTVNDYDLENQIISGFSATTNFPRVGNSADVNNICDSRKLVATLTVTNTSSEDLVISELGYIRGSSSNSKQALYDRIVFDTPVTIAPNETKTFEYRLHMPQP